MYGFKLRYGCALAAGLTIASGVQGDQTVFLDFTGGTGAPGGSSNTANKKAFKESSVVAAYIDANNSALDTKEEVATKMMDDILAKMQDQYKGFWVSFTKTAPGAGKFSSVDFGANTTGSSATTLGTVDTGPGSQIDPGNKTKDDDAWVFADAHTKAGRSMQQSVNELATSASHELGHLLGLTHDDGGNGAGSIMDGTFSGAMHGFTDGSKGKLANTVGLMVGGKHVTVQELIDSILGAISEAARLTSTFDPGAGPLGSVILGGDQPSVFPGTSTVTGGTIKRSNGFHGDAFGINDPLGDFFIVMPDQLEVVGFDTQGNPVLQDSTVLFVQDPLIPIGTEILQMQLTGVHFDPDATLVDFPGTPGSAVVVDDTTAEATPGLTEPLGGFVGEAQIFINPGLLGMGTYLDELDAMLQSGFQTEFFLSTDLDQQSNGFTAFGATGFNNTGFRLFLPGDLDGDGFVGITDLNIVLSAWNQAVPPGDPLADPSGDGFVGIDDLNLVLGNWNAGIPPSSGSAVPEPAGLAILTFGALGLLRRRPA
jgi:hypothetical protein